MKIKKNFLIGSLLILLVTLISYGQTIFMYFWQDDSALIFKLQHQAEMAGSFGAGLFDRGPYRYLVVPFVPFFPIFKLNPFGYFLIGFITYLLIILALYWMLKGFIKETKYIYLGCLVFAAGYIGSDTMFRVINSWQTNIGIVFGLITIGFYLRLKANKKPIYYLLSLLFYLISIEFVYIRSHALIAAIFVIDIVDFILTPKNKSKFFYLVLRLTPFLSLFFLWYLQDASFGAPGIKSILDKIVHEHEFTLMMPLLANVGEAIFPEKIANYLLQFTKSPLNIFLSMVFGQLVFSVLLVKKHITNKISTIISGSLFIFLSLFALVLFGEQIYYFKDTQSLLYVLISLIFVSQFISLLFSNISNNTKILIALGLIVLFSQIGSYYIQYPTSIFTTTHRYFSYAFVGYVLLTVSIFKLFGNNKAILGGLVLIFIVPATFLSFKYQHQILVDRSIPSKNFYENLLKFTPQIEKGSLFYFDVARDPYVEKQFGDFFSVGSMPETTALAIYYNLDRYDMKLITDFDQLTFELSKDPSLIKKTLAYKYTKSGLVDITDELRSELSQSVTTKLDKPIRTDTYIEATIEIASRWEDFSPRNVEKTISINDLAELINEQKEKRFYYQNVKASSLSEWSGRETYHVVDQDIGSAWQGHRIYWGDNHRESLTLDLGSIQNISGLTWYNWRFSLTPTSYSILLSKDNKNWHEVANENGGGKKDGEPTTILFKTDQVRYVQFVITKTLTDDSPAIGEIYVFNTQSKLSNKEDLLDNPFNYIKASNEWNKLIQEYSKEVPITVTSVKQNRSASVETQTLYISPTSNRKYKVIVPPGGDYLNGINVSSKLPLNITIKDIKVKNLTLESMIKNNLIKIFSVN